MTPRIVMINVPEGAALDEAREVVTSGTVGGLYNLLSDKDMEMLDILVTEAAEQIARTALEDRLRGFGG